MLTWMDAVEQCCSLQLSRAEPTLEGNEETMTLLQNPPPGWTLEADEELAKFLVKNSNKFNTDVTAQGSEYLVKIEASSAEVKGEEREGEGGGEQRLFLVETKC